MATPSSYENDIPPLPPLDVALSQLFDLPPTREALVHYRSNRHLLKGGALERWGGVIHGARSNEFTITNIFSSEEPGLSIHDIVHRNYLEDFSPDIARAWRQAAGCDDAEDRDFWDICFWLRAAWISALDAYASEPTSLADPGHRGGLFLHPRLPTLPAPALIEELYRDRAWTDLVLLTARHELGWYYLKVKTWHTTAKGLSDISDAHLGACLTADELQELSMRTQGYYYYTLTATDSMDVDSPNLPPNERHDAPRQAFSAASDVARLYYLLTQWYLKTYKETVRAPQCTWKEGSVKCQRLLPKYKGRGTHPQFCPFHARMSTTQSKKESRQTPPEAKRRYTKRQMRNE